jgi:hypothetical protein
MSIGMSIEEQFAEALSTSDPRVSLRSTAQALLAAGNDHADVVAELEKYRTVLQARGQDDDEDIILEVLDFLEGWCSPHMKL